MSSIAMMNSETKGGPANPPPGALSIPPDQLEAANAQAALDRRVKAVADVFRENLAYEYELQKEMAKATDEFAQKRRAEDYRAFVGHLRRFRTRPTAMT
ncbi:hypothetical protein V501_07961 [Pseudogymnoascus sp. VKM F-4519 (FW-2642)]|nr:hypothetical protein V501_07961 [Pseudogymnoascus sp. VKM F-4519 (FW-2642)]